MMRPLDDAAILNRFSSSMARESIEALPEQCIEAWNDTVTLPLPESHRACQQIIIAGMGGSALGAHVLKALFADTLRVPFFIVENYALPACVDKNSLVLCISYSGSTEEALSVYREARQRRCAMIAIAVGGRLIEQAASDHVPYYVLRETHNPSRMPRMGVGMTLGAELGILANLGFLPMTDNILQSTLVEMRTVRDQWSVTSPVEQNLAKQIAESMVSRLPVLVASEHLSGNMILARNQIHENAKTYADAVEIPDINHHLMEGLGHPSPIPYLFLFFRSMFYHAQNQKRFALTERIVQEQGIQTMTVDVFGATRLAQSMYTLQLLASASYYVSLLNNVNPALIPWVDAFKKQLAT